jgi:hypothetical protein
VDVSHVRQVSKLYPNVVNANLVVKKLMEYVVSSNDACSMVAISSLKEFMNHFAHLNETLHHIPSSCIAVMVQVVKGRQYSAYTDQRNQLSISIVTSFDASINSIAQYSFKLQIGSGIRKAPPRL